MVTLERALDGAIELVLQGKSLEEALAQYPEHAQQLQPLLLVTMQVSKVGEALPSPAFKARGRALLEGSMAAAPRRGGRNPLFKLAASMAALLLTLATATTAMAQSALPGDALHPWKLYSEQVWRSLQTNPVQADLQIAQRRLEELLAVDGDPERVPAALSAYASALDVLRTQLEALPDRAFSAQQALHGQRDQVQSALEAAGTTVDEVFTILPTLDVLITANPVQVPLSTPVEQIQLVVPVIPAISPSKPEQPADASSDSASSENGKSNIVEQIGNALNSVIDSLTAPEK
ncbi:MAG: hypothetical protein KIT70_00145 [Anaerolineales bacterium]|nr:MAG: hypothetical protein KIT70_00145 [Anaerolineales bacterium]